MEIDIEGEVLKNGIIGTIDEKMYIYCNEKDPNRSKFLFSCCDGCEHNPIE